ncbi:MAG: hypothetical protein AB7V50_06205 [Vampirovibrionia bacterium]
MSQLSLYGPTLTDQISQINPNITSNWKDHKMVSDKKNNSLYFAGYKLADQPSETTFIRSKPLNNQKQKSKIIDKIQTFFQ